MLDDPEAQARQCDVCLGWTYEKRYCPWCPDAAPLSEFERLQAAEDRGEYVDWDAHRRKVWGDAD